MTIKDNNDKAVQYFAIYNTMKIYLTTQTTQTNVKFLPVCWNYTKFGHMLLARSKLLH